MTTTVDTTKQQSQAETTAAVTTTVATTSTTTNATTATTPTTPSSFKLIKKGTGCGNWNTIRFKLELDDKPYTPAECAHACSMRTEWCTHFYVRVFSTAIYPINHVCSLVTDQCTPGYYQEHDHYALTTAGSSAQLSCCDAVHVTDSSGTTSRYTSNSNALAYELPAGNGHHDDHALYYASARQHWHLSTMSHAVSHPNSEDESVEASSLEGEGLQCPNKANWSLAGYSLSCSEPTISSTTISTASTATTTTTITRSNTFPPGDTTTTHVLNQQDDDSTPVTPNLATVPVKESIPATTVSRFVQTMTSVATDLDSSGSTPSKEAPLELIIGITAGVALLFVVLGVMWHH